MTCPSANAPGLQGGCTATLREGFTLCAVGERIGLRSLSIAVAVVCVVSARTESACLRLGYRSFSVTVTDRYCVTRIDQTDVVVPLSEARQR